MRIRQPQHPADRASLRRRAIRGIIEHEQFRQRISRALHDDLGQLLMVLNLELYWLSRHCETESVVASRIDRMRAIVARSGYSMQQLLRDCRPIMPASDPSFAEIVESLLQRFHHDHDLRCQARISGNIDRIDGEDRIVLSRILHCCLSALTRYAGTREFLLHCTCDDDAVMLVIEDKSCSVAEPLSGAHRRLDIGDLVGWIEAFDGDITTDAEHGIALRIRLDLPLSPDWL